MFHQYNNKKFYKWKKKKSCRFQSRSRWLAHKRGHVITRLESLWTENTARTELCDLGCTSWAFSTSKLRAWSRKEDEKATSGIGRKPQVQGRKEAKGAKYQREERWTISQLLIDHSDETQELTMTMEQHSNHWWP
jgi:hypothetical protein